MANDSIDHLNILSETDLFSTTMSQDESFTNEFSSIDKTRHFKNLPGAMPISFNQMFRTQNSNAPWLINMLKKKFSRSRFLTKRRENRNSSIRSTTDDEILDKPISIDGTSGKWLVDEKDLALPLIKDFDLSNDRQYNVSRAMSSSTPPMAPSTDESLHLRHYHYDFQTLTTPTSSSIASLDRHPHHPHQETHVEGKRLNDAVDFPSIVSQVKRVFSKTKEDIDLHICSDQVDQSMEINDEIKVNNVRLLINNDLPVEKRSKRAKSASAAANPTTKKRSNTTKKNKRQYYREHQMSQDEIDLREALRIIDLDNVGFFPPHEFRQVLKDIGISSHDIEKIEHCLPLDDDGHYSIDNLIKLLLNQTN